MGDKIRCMAGPKNLGEPPWLPPLLEKNGYMTYKEALKESRIIGASKAEGLALLAQTIHVLCGLHAVNPEMAYNGAVLLGLSAKEVHKLDPVSFGDLMFV